MNSRIKISIIGLGRQNLRNHLPAILESDIVALDSVMDIDPLKIQDVSKKYNVDGFTDLDKLLKEKRPDLAVVAVPHDKHLPIISSLAKSGVHILKEKPLAIDLFQARQIDKIAIESGIKIFVTLQRRFNPIFQAFNQLIQRIGRVHNIEGKYTMNILQLDDGWRAFKKTAGGGALLDMGYHYIDLLVWYFGVPQNVTAKMGMGNKVEQNYDVEDTARLLLDFSDNKSKGQRTIGDFLISRIYPEKKEELIAYGTKGFVKLQRGLVQRFDSTGELKDSLERKGGWPSAAVDQIDFFAKAISGEVYPSLGTHRSHFKHLAIIESAYKSNEEGKSIDPILMLNDYERHF